MERSLRRDELRKFEYAELRQRVIRDSQASYTLMTALVALSEAILAATLTNLGHISMLGRIGAATASLSALFFWFLIDRRFVWAEKKRQARMSMIERELNIYNERIFDEETEIRDSELAERIEKVNEESGIFARISIHGLYLVLAGFMIIAWILVTLA